MNEFDQYSRLDELEALRDFVPAWAKAPLEPFISSAQQDVTGPNWRPILEAGSPTQGSTTTGADQQLFRCVIGIFEGGSFTPKLAYVVGPLEDIP